MLSAERHARIDEALRRKPVVRSDELATVLGVSLETIRRDLRELENRGALRRVHGGAARRNGFLGGEGDFAERSNRASQAKEAIGRAARSLVEPGQTLLIDVGTTAQYVARALATDFRGSVVTPSLLVALELRNSPSVDVMVTPGHMRLGDMALAGPSTVDFLRGVHADIAFLGSGGIDTARGLTDYYLDEIASRRIMIRNSGRSYVLADSGKFDGVARYSVAGFTDFTGIITEQSPPQPLAEAITTSGGEIVVA